MYTQVVRAMYLLIFLLMLSNGYIESDRLNSDSLDDKESLATGQYNDLVPQ